MSEEDKELLRISLENSLRLARQMAKQKFTPKNIARSEHAMDIKDDVKKLIEKYDTADPFKIAKIKKIKVIFEDLGSMWGYHIYDLRFHFIHINQRLDEKQQRFACAHELGHVKYHPKESMTFLQNVMTCPPRGIERTAHTFAVELILQDELIHEHPDCSIYDIARMVGVPEKLVILKNFTP